MSFNPQMIPGSLVSLAEGLLLIVFRSKISVFLERSYRKFPTNKISEQFYKVSYKVNPIYIAVLGCVFLIIAFIRLFQQ